MASDENPEIRLHKNFDDTSVDKDILKKTSRFNKTDSTRIKKSELNDDVKTQAVVKAQPKLAAAEEVLDPMTLRDSDTSKLKRIKPKSSTQTISLDSENISDTVHLKVIKEKKKQLAGILTASQTIRLRPPSESGRAAPPVSAGTLKLSNSASGGTVNLPPGSSPAGTLKINMPATSSESGTIKVSKPSFDDASVASGTLKIKSPVSVDTGASGGGTLKIKSASGGASPSGTLKLKASSGDQTVRMQGDDKKSGTLKLKGAASPSVKQAPRSVPQESYDAAVVDDLKSQPGVFITLLSLTTLSGVAFAVFKLIDNYLKLFAK
jgi:hypothetical protein